MDELANEREARTLERGIRPLALAFALSLVCHALVLGALRSLRLESRPPLPLVVTMLGGGDAGGDGAALPAKVAAASAPAAAVAAPVVPAPAVVQRPAAVRPVRERERVSRAREVASAPPIAAPAVAAAPTPPSVTGAGVGVVDGTAVAVASAGGALGGVGGGGAGRGTGGAGSGGSDGLRALCASCPAPEYPGRARRQGWQGTVDVELAIAPDGSVQEARVGRSSGYPALDDVAVDVARRSRFTVPDGGDGLRGQLRYRFVLDATAASR